MINNIINYIKNNPQKLFCYFLIFAGILLFILVFLIKPHKLTSEGLYSITNPDAYIQSNLIGFYNILEACRHSYDNEAIGVEHLVYASSSSVYGTNKKVPYSTVINSNYGYASAIGVVCFSILLVFSILYLKITKYGKEGELS